MIARFVSFADQRPWVLLPFFIFTFLTVMWPAATRPLWFDELVTYRIAQSPDLGHMLRSIVAVDLNPPLFYLLERASLFLLGNSPLSARLPSMLTFLAASVILFEVVRRRTGGATALFAIVAFWSTSFTPYAVEARAYATLLFLLVSAMASWTRATGEEKWTWHHVALGVSLTTLILTHCFAPVFAAAVGVGELVRWWTTRRLNLRVWIMILAPLTAIATYLPLIQTTQSVVFSPEIRVTIATIPRFYLIELATVLPVILVICGSRFAPGRRPTPDPFGQVHERASWVWALSAPMVIVGLCAAVGAPFWFRYGSGAAAGLTFLLVAWFVCANGNRPGVALACTILLLSWFVVRRGGTRPALEPFVDSVTDHRAIRADLPLVASSALTFYEMAHREPGQLLDRLFYLTDQESALRYGRSDLFESLGTLVHYLPVRSTVMRYDAFVRTHRQFLVLATPGQPGRWLLQKLEVDGATFKTLLTAKLGYEDRVLMEVSLPPQLKSQ